MTNDREFCDSCQRWLAHDKRYCPLFPDVSPPRRFCGGGRKWSECCCLIHTCYVAPKRDRATAPEYSDFTP